ncbi:MAG: hypothetical protein ACOYL5_11930 [Phototrophicaceae bacterium]|jgi:hypothetical protein
MAQDKPQNATRVRRVRRLSSAATPADKRKSEQLSAEHIADMLAHPRFEVSEDQLRQEYGYVLKDLSSMGILAAALFLALIALGIAQAWL